MTNITRTDLIKRLSEKSGYYQKDIQVLLKALDEVVLDCFAEVDEDNDVEIQLIEGAKLKVVLVPERERVDPRDHKPITVKATVKPGIKYSQLFRQKIQQNYEDKKE